MTSGPGIAVVRCTPSGVMTIVQVIDDCEFQAYTLQQICTGPDDNLWICDMEGDSPSYTPFIARCSTTGTLTTFAAPNGASGSRVTPVSICIGPSGDDLWMLGTDSGVADGPTDYPPNTDIFSIATDGTMALVTDPGDRPIVLPWQDAPPADLQTQHVMCVGPDGNMWVLTSTWAELDPPYSRGINNLVYFWRITPDGVVTGYEAAAESPDTGYSARAICVGSDGALYGLTNYNLYRCTTAGVITQIGSFPIYSSMAAGSDGNIWVVEKAHGSTSATVYKIVPPGLSSTSYTWATGLPSSQYSNIAPIMTGPDGELWGSVGPTVVFEPDVIQRFDISTQVATQFAIPPDAADNPSGGPSVIPGCIGPDGNMYFVGAIYSKTSGYAPLRVFQRDDAYGVRAFQFEAAGNSPQSVRALGAGNSYT